MEYPLNGRGNMTKIKKTCTNCQHRDGGVCYNCVGVNYGNCTEVHPEYVCKNWVFSDRDDNDKILGS